MTFKYRRENGFISRVMCNFAHFNWGEGSSTAFSLKRKILH